MDTGLQIWINRRWQLHRYSENQKDAETCTNSLSHTHKQGFISLPTHGQLLEKADMPTSQPKILCHPHAHCRNPSLPARQTQMWGGTQHYFCYAGSYFTETSFLGVNGWKFPHKTFIFDQNCLINTAWTEINCLLPSLTHLLSHCTVLTINSTKPLFLLKHWVSDSLFSDKQVFIVDWVTFCIARSSAEKPPSKHSINLRVTFTLKKGIQVMIK